MIEPLDCLIECDEESFGTKTDFDIDYIVFDEVYSAELKLEKREDKWILTSVRYLSEENAS